MCKEKSYKAPAVDVCDQLGGGAGRETLLQGDSNSWQVLWSPEVTSSACLCDYKLLHN